MALTSNEIRAGILAYLEPAVLHARPDVDCPARDVPPDMRPFICAFAEGGRSIWAGLTTQTRPAWVPPEEFINGYGQMMLGRCFVHGTVYIGPDDAFVTASANERPFPSGQRPELTPMGLEIVKNNVRLPRRSIR